MFIILFLTTMDTVVGRLSSYAAFETILEEEVTTFLLMLRGLKCSFVLVTLCIFIALGDFLPDVECLALHGL